MAAGILIVHGEGKVTDFLILTDLHGDKRLAALNQIIHIDWAEGGGSRLYLIGGTTIQVKESVDTITDTLRNLSFHS